MSTPGDVTILLDEIRRGNRRAESELIPMIYSELHRLAAFHMRGERPDHTLQPTALVNEVYLKLMKQRKVVWQSKAHFFAIASRLMRRVLVDHARERNRDKRGGKQQKVDVEEKLLFTEQRPVDLIQLDLALEQLGKEYPRQCQVVEMQYFGGLSVEEIAEVLQVSSKTVKRDWSEARARLYRQMCKEEAE